MSLLANTEQRPAIRAAHPARAHHFAHFFHRILHAQRLLVEKRPGARPRIRRSGRNRLMSRRPPADVLRALAANLEHRADLRVERAHRARDGLELVLEKQPEHLGDRPAAATRSRGSLPPAVSGTDA